MQKGRKALVSFLVMAMCFGSAITPTVAAQEVLPPDITPRYNNTSSTYTTFNITNTGYATVSTYLYGISGMTSGATIVSYLERKFLGLFWIRVGIGQPNDEWKDSVIGSNSGYSHSTQLTDKGEYRAVITYTVNGTGGSSDVIPVTIYRSY